MARPKTGKPPKQKLTITVSAETREIMASLSEQKCMSISAMVEDWAAKELELTERGKTQGGKENDN